MEIRLYEEFDAPARAVWQVMGTFHGLQTWFPGVTACARDDGQWGEVRRAEVAGRVTPERLEHYDNAGMTLAWTLVDVPLLGDHRSTLKIVPLGEDRCAADWVFYADLQPPLTSEMIEENTRAMYGAALAEVRRRLT